MPQDRPPQTAAWIALDRVHSLMSRQLQNRMTEYDVTRPQYSVLRLLLESGPQTANALSSSMGVTPGNLTGVIDRLEAGGYLARQRDPSDRRCIHLSLTPAGEHKAREIIPGIRGTVAGFFAALDPRQLTDFLSSLQALEAALDTEDGQDTPSRQQTPEVAAS
ncbi:MarR family transcriptional regulator [Deinococcus sp. KNUC1210]|uniref:MarR family winged helix-turn-helix transcriptional regulator n=1 Tax=Deinococcus sp. KNUC1210 TaxID=2917691 RepID=UPI001EF074FB|nr:MarR family transcriptional regulator [Deinococcus sp. KNUC1210]ULH14460.1 MarR family transcriptional regulator [Deinococcus sp. KNUC1210]